MTDPNTEPKPKRVAVYIDYSFIRQIADQIGRLNLLLLSQYLKFDDLLVKQLTFIPIIVKNGQIVNDMHNFICALQTQDMEIVKEDFHQTNMETPVVSPETVMEIVMEDFGNLNLEIAVLVTDKLSWIPVVDALRNRGVLVEIAGILSTLPKALTYNVAEVYDLANPEIFEKIKFEDNNRHQNIMPKNNQIQAIQQLAHVS